MLNDSYKRNQNESKKERFFKEEFRKQAISYGVADKCVIDKNTYAEITCIKGCFKTKEEWVVYNTDERAEVYYEKKYKNAEAAFWELASRLGFTFKIPLYDNNQLKNAKEVSSKSVFRTLFYEPQKALELVCKSSKAKFDETVELHIKLGVDSRHADQQVRGAIVLPHGTGKAVRVLVFCKEERIQEAIEAGADYAGGIDLVQKIQGENWFEFDTVIASPDMMGTVGRLGKVLGPKGLMPSPKSGTVTPNIATAVKEAKAGKIEYRLDKANIIHCPIGKVSFGAEKLNENYEALIGAIIKAKPAAAKGEYIRSCFTASTMGRGIRIDTRKTTISDKHGHIDQRLIIKTE